MCTHVVCLSLMHLDRQSYIDVHRFGNITTMEWWDTLYLNEGFASLVSRELNISALAKYRLFAWSGGRVYHPR